LVAMIFFSRRTVYIRFVGTHREYDAIDVSTI
jgi:mRNA interferase HigB